MGREWVASGSRVGREWVAGGSRVGGWVAGGSRELLGGPGPLEVIPDCFILFVLFKKKTTNSNDSECFHLFSRDPMYFTQSSCTALTLQR